MTAKEYVFSFAISIFVLPACAYPVLCFMEYAARIVTNH